MRRLVVSTFVSLDGVVQAPGGPTEDESGGFALGGWTVPFFDESVGQFMDELMGHPFDLVLGRRTYDIFAGFWPTASEEEGAKPLNDAVKHVASRGRPELSWERSQLIEGDVAEGVAALKAQDGPELQVHGSGELLRTLTAAGLVDEYRLLVFPVLLGRGKRLWHDDLRPASLQLVSSRVSSTGVVMAVYAPTGEVTTGSFGG
jgi:dihydrofolate reductase